MSIVVQSTTTSSLATAASDLINKAATQLLDDSNTRWTRTELLGWLNDGQRQIVILQPNASAITAAMQLVQGTRQQLPADGWMLLDIYRNMGPNGLSPGRAVRLISRTILDAQNPNWHTDTPTGTVYNYIFDIQDSNAFYVYPPSNGANYVEINYSTIPANLSDETQLIALKPIFGTALLDYMLYRACSKDAEFAGTQQAGQYLQTFMASMGKLGVEEETNNVNQSLGKGNAQPQPGATS
jgi:hypothetical protein